MKWGLAQQVTPSFSASKNIYMMTMITVDIIGYSCLLPQILGIYPQTNRDTKRGIAMLNEDKSTYQLQQYSYQTPGMAKRCIDHDQMFL